VLGNHLERNWYIIICTVFLRTASVVWWSKFMTKEPEDPGSISDATGFSEKQGSGMWSTQPREDK
jgi:hypothetical protein